MKLLKSVITLGLALSVLAWAEPSQAGIGKSGITGGAFLKIGVGARAVALGSAYTSVSGDANQMFWNPAGITLAEGRTQVAVNYNAWIADLGHNAVGVTRGFGGIGTLGIGIVNLSLSGIDNGSGLDRDVVPGFLDDSYEGFRDGGSGDYDYSDVALQLTWARDVTNRLALGATGKYISQDIDGVTASAFALDFGALYKLGFNNATIGARLNNLGGDLEFYNIGAPLPLIFSIGGAIDLYDDPDSGIRVTLLSDATKPQDGDQLLFSAAEVQVFNMLSLRGGYKFNYSGVDDDKIDKASGLPVTHTRYIGDAPRTEEGLTFGAGVNVPLGGFDTIVDYAYTDFGILDSVHRVSLQLQF